MLNTCRMVATTLTAADVRMDHLFFELTRLGGMVSKDIVISRDRYGGHGLFLLSDVAAGTELLSVPRACMLEPQTASLCSCWTRDEHPHNKNLIKEVVFAAQLFNHKDTSPEQMVAALSVQELQEQRQQQQKQSASHHLAGIEQTKLPRIQLASALLCNLRHLEEQHQDQQSTGKSETGLSSSGPLTVEPPACCTTRLSCSSWASHACMPPSLFSAYSASLPSSTDLQFIPLLWPSRDLVSHLPARSTIKLALDCQQESTQLEVEAVLPGLGITREQYLWASTIVASRGIQLWAGPTLVPVLDMLNHTHPPSVVCMLGTGEQGEQHLSIQAIRNMRKGDELCWCYSSHDNDAAWLLSYGFVPADTCSSHPILPPHVSQELYIPNSGTETSESSSEHDSDTSSESYCSDSDVGDSGPTCCEGQEACMDRDDRGLPPAASMSEETSRTQAKDCMDHSTMTAYQNSDSTAGSAEVHECTQGSSEEVGCKQESTTTLMTAVGHLKDLDLALEQIQALALNHSNGLITLLQRERDYLKKAMNESTTAAAKRHNQTTCL